MAIIAMNSASEASAAASWIIALNIKSTVSMIALQRNSPSPSQVPYQIDLEGQRFPSLVLEISPLTVLFQDFFTHPRALPVPQERNAGSSVGPMTTEGTTSGVQ
jgi:hypothetical protein